MFEGFTERARRVVVLAHEEARGRNHDHVDTEHLLLALLQEREGGAVRALLGIGVPLEDVRSRLDEIVGRGQAPPSDHVPFAPGLKRVMERCLREALPLGHNHIGTEHLLLALVNDGESAAAQVLAQFGADPSRVGEQILS